MLYASLKLVRSIWGKQSQTGLFNNLFPKYQNGIDLRYLIICSAKEWNVLLSLEGVWLFSFFDNLSCALSTVCWQKHDARCQFASNTIESKNDSYKTTTSIILTHFHWYFAKSTNTWLQLKRKFGICPVMDYECFIYFFILYFFPFIPSFHWFVVIICTHVWANTSNNRAAKLVILEFPNSYFTGAQRTIGTLIMILGMSSNFYFIP